MSTVAVETLHERLLAASTEGTAAACEEIAGEILVQLEEVVPQAVAGNPAAVRLYVSISGTLLDRLLSGVRRETPTSTTPDLLDRARPFLLWGALEAPFAGWVQVFGPGLGTALGLVARVRAVAGSPQLAGAGRGGPDVWGMDAEEWLRFRSLVERELRSSLGSAAVLARVRELFDLNLTELGALFGATRQAATKWLAEGLPPARYAKAATIVSLGELLERTLRPGRLPAVARRRAAAYGGRSILERIAADEHEALLAEVESSLDWAATA